MHNQVSLTLHLHPLSFTVEDSSNAIDESNVAEAQSTENEEKDPSVEGSEKGGSYPFLEHRHEREKPSLTELMRCWNIWQKAER